MNDLLDEFLSANPDVQHVELINIDPSGIARGKWAPVSALKKAFGEGVNFPLSLHGLDAWGNEVPQTGLHIESGDLDGFCKAVPTSLSAVPWGGRQSDTERPSNAQVILQMSEPDGAPFQACSRTVLESVVSGLEDDGLTAVCAFELEFHLLREESGKDGFAIASIDGLPDAQFMYGLDALAQKSGFFADVRQAAQWAHLPIDTIVKEAGPGQFEVNLNHRADALRAADDVVLLKRAIQECARKHDMIASFMAKPFIGQPGNGMHVHTSLLDEKGVNVFSGADGKERQRHAVTGLYNTLSDMTLVFINTFNGFRRMASGSYAPTRINWGENNRSVALRLPAAPDEAQRVEHRVSGADANPYLVLSAIIHGMAMGLRNADDPPDALIGNAYEAATLNRGEPLPDTLERALSIFVQSEFATHTLGEQMKSVLSAIKQAEIDGFANDISPMERRTYI